MLFIYFTSLPQFPLPPLIFLTFLHTPPLPHPLLTFLFRKGGVSHGYQPALAYQVAVRPHTPFPVEARQGSTVRGKDLRAGNSIRDSSCSYGKEPHMKTHLHSYIRAEGLGQPMQAPWWRFSLCEPLCAQVS